MRSLVLIGLIAIAVAIVLSLLAPFLISAGEFIQHVEADRQARKWTYWHAFLRIPVHLFAAGTPFLEFLKNWKHDWLNPAFREAWKATDLKKALNTDTILWDGDVTVARGLIFTNPHLYERYRRILETYHDDANGLSMPQRARLETLTQKIGLKANRSPSSNARSHTPSHPTSKKPEEKRKRA